MFKLRITFFFNFFLIYLIYVRCCCCCFCWSALFEFSYF